MFLVNRIVGLFFITSFTAFSSVMASELVLKDGRVVDGKILERTAKYVKFDIDGGLGRMTYYFDEIDTVDGQKFQTTASSTSNNDIQKTGSPVESQSNDPLQSEEFKKYYEQATQASDAGNFEEAVDNYKKALDMNPNDYGANLGLGTILYDHEKLDEAVFYLKKAVEIKPDSLAANIAAGATLRTLHNLDEAKVYLEKANQIDPRNPRPYVDLATVYLEKGNFNEALQCLESGKNMVPDDPGIYMMFGIVYGKQGLPAQAQDNLMKARDLFKKEGNFDQALHMDKLLTQLDEGEINKYGKNHFLFIILVLGYLCSCFFLQNIGEKLNHPNSWYAWIPLLNVFYSYELAGLPWTFVFLGFVELIPYIGSFLFFCVSALPWMFIANRLKKSDWLGFLMFIPGVNVIILGYLALE